MLLSTLVKKVFIAGCLMAISSSAFSQALNANWQSDLDKALIAYKQCSSDSTNSSEKCSNLAGEILKTVYNLNDFYSSEYKRFMVSNEVANYIENNQKWELLGHAYEQNALEKAQELANSKRAVVAVYVDDNADGHVSIILPGQLVLSGSWGFKVPNSTSFFVHEPDKSYVGKGLSYAFTRSMIKNVMIFARSY